MAEVVQRLIPQANKLSGSIFQGQPRRIGCQYQRLGALLRRWSVVAIHRFDRRRQPASSLISVRRSNQQTLAAGTDRRQYRPATLLQQQKHHIFGGFFQGFQQRVGGIDVQLVRPINNGHLAGGHLGRADRECGQRTNLINLDHP